MSHRLRRWFTKIELFVGVAAPGPYIERSKASFVLGDDAPVVLLPGFDFGNA